MNEMLTLADRYECPLIIAGDIFDRWNSPPELINFAMDVFIRFPQVSIYAIPGQHDLPNHRRDQVHRSAYWTLHTSDFIEDFGLKHINVDGRIIIAMGFPWGFDVRPLLPSDRQRQDAIKLAVVHSYIWKKGHSYPGADPRQRVGNYVEPLEGFDSAAFGDNHKGFIVQTPNLKIINCGTLMRRKIDEIDYKPQVGLLYEDGAIEPYYLDTELDKFIDVSDVELHQFKVGENLIEELRHLEVDSLDFREAVIRRMDAANIDRNVREIVLESIE